jgi:DNA-binding response OmpR family regulator
MPPLEHVRAVVVDDEVDARQLLALILSHAGAEVFEASSAKDAYHLLYRTRAQLLVSDIAMPDEDGLSLVRRVRAIERTWGWRVAAVAVSARSRPEDRAAALEAGFQAYVAKPALPDTIIATIRRVGGSGLLDGD